MDISSISNWSGVAGGILLGATWIWKLQRWFREKVAHAREASELDSELAAVLLNQATSPARRADIHAFILFRCMEVESSHIRSRLLSLATGCLVSVLGLSLSFARRVFDTEAMPWLWWFTVAMFASVLISFVMALFYDRLLRTIEKGWHQCAGEVLHQRAIRHVPET